MLPLDPADQALALTRDEFCAQNPHPFFFCGQVPERPQRAVGTDILDQTSAIQLLRADAPGERDRRPTPVAVKPWAIAIKKVQAAFPSMITIGRTRNNDVIVEDTLVSKFHAFLRTTRDRWELVDAGSRNGTFVAGRRLEARGAGVELKIGDRVRFGRLDFVFLDAATCWDHLVRAQDRWG
jgi:hypothetical protein